MTDDTVSVSADAISSAGQPTTSFSSRTARCFGGSRCSKAMKASATSSRASAARDGSGNSRASGAGVTQVATSSSASGASGSRSSWGSARGRLRVSALRHALVAMRISQCATGASPA